MITSVRRARVHRLLLAALVVGLLAGLVGMHHLAAGAASPVGAASAASVPMPAGAMPPSGDGHGGDGHADDALLHLCLAVLVAVGALVATALVLWWRAVAAPAPPVTAARRVRTAPRAPPCGAPARLALLCVLRT